MKKDKNSPEAPPAPVCDTEDIGWNKAMDAAADYVDGAYFASSMPSGHMLRSMKRPAPADKPTFAEELSMYITRNNQLTIVLSSWELKNLIENFMADNHYSVHQKKG